MMAIDSYMLISEIHWWCVCVSYFLSHILCKVFGEPESAGRRCSCESRSFKGTQFSIELRIEKPRWEHTLRPGDIYRNLSALDRWTSWGLGRYNLHEDITDQLESFSLLEFGRHYDRSKLIHQNLVHTGYLAYLWHHLRGLRRSFVLWIFFATEGDFTPD